MLSTSLIPTSTTEQLNIWLRKDSMRFTTGLMIWPGIHSAESSVVPFTQVGYNNLYVGVGVNGRVVFFYYTYCFKTHCIEMEVFA